MRTVVLVLLLIVVPSSVHCQTIPRRALQYQRDLIANARFVWGLNAPIAVLAAQLHQESGWNTDAKSPFAGGLAQFTPGTSEDISRKYPELGVARPFEPSWALRAQSLYDRDLYFLAKAALSDCHRWGFALSAYNGGQGWVNRQKKATKAAGGDDRAWFGSVEDVRVRAEWAHKENRMYPRAILLKHQPLYRSWGLGVGCPGVV